SENARTPFGRGAAMKGAGEASLARACSSKPVVVVVTLEILSMESDSPSPVPRQRSWSLRGETGADGRPEVEDRDLHPDTAGDVRVLGDPLLDLIPAGEIDQQDRAH